MRTLINDTKYGQATNLNKSSQEALKFLLSRRSSVELTRKQLVGLENLQGIGSTAIQLAYKNLINEGLMINYLPMDFRTVRNDVPDVMTLDEITIDGSWLEHTPENLQKVWVNLTPTLAKKDATPDYLSVSNVSRMMGYFVRGLFCAAYANKEIWLSSTFSPFVVETYSTACRNRLSQAYNLDIQAGMLVQTAFAYHYAKLLGREDDDSLIPPLIHRCGFLGNQNDVTSRIHALADTQEGSLYEDGIISICDALSKAGPERMRSFDASTFYRMFSVGNIDQMALSISMDYPPYWVFLLLKHVSGSKNAMMSMLFRQDRLKKRLGTWTEQLVKNQELYRWS